MATLKLSHLTSEHLQTKLTPRQEKIRETLGDDAPIYAVLGVESCIDQLIKAGISDVELPEPSYRYTSTGYFEKFYYPRDLTYKIVTSLEHLDARTSGWLITSNRGCELCKCLEKFI